MQRKTGLHPEKPRAEVPKEAPASAAKASASLFDADMLAQLNAVFGRMANPLVLKLQLDDRPVSEELKNYMQELASLTENLRERAQTLLEQRIAQAEDTSEIYDENNEYREDFVMAALYDAAQEALEQDARTTSWELTLNLIYENGQWWIMPEPGLLVAISGGILR